MTLQRMPIDQLRELARRNHPDHTAEAARVFVDRILDLEAERRTLYGADHLQGVIGCAIAPGWAPGGTDIAREPLASLYARGILHTRETHEYARRWLEAARLPPRQHLAALIQARKLHGNGDQGAGKAWAAGYDKIAGNLGHYAQLLGFSPQQPVRPTLCRDPKTGAPLRAVETVKDKESGETTERATPRPRWDADTFRTGKAISAAATNAKAALILLAKLPAE